MSMQPIVTNYRELDGIYIRPCVGSGYCCTQRPCEHGEWNADQSACKHLQEPNEFGQRGCGIFDYIKKINPNWAFHPAFGSGCSSAIVNVARDAVIQKLPEQIKKKIR